LNAFVTFPSSSFLFFPQNEAATAAAFRHNSSPPLSECQIYNAVKGKKEKVGETKRCNIV
jgi:hypothetical protein